jgi:hypothetical protein
MKNHQTESEWESRGDTIRNKDESNLFLLYLVVVDEVKEQTESNHSQSAYTPPSLVILPPLSHLHLTTPHNQRKFFLPVWELICQDAEGAKEGITFD